MKSRIRTASRFAIALAAVLVSGAVCLWAATRGPDAGGYTATDEVIFSFVDISGASGGASVLGGTDDGTAALTLPFPVRYYGQSYSVVCVSTNGILYFVPSAGECAGYDGDFANVDLTSATVPRDGAALMPFWTDLTFQVAGAGSVLYQTLGAAPSRRFVVQWQDAFPQGSTNPVTFELILEEGGSAVTFQYAAVELGAGNPASSGAQATVGIRNAAGLAHRQQIQWSYRAPVVSDRTALRFAPLDTTAPVVAAAVTPLVLWPPNGQEVPVTVTGSVTDGQGVAQAEWSVLDEYGVLQPTGTIVLAPDGGFTVTASLVASRHGSDRDGRTYTIVIRASDPVGNVGTTRVIVTVPHDQRK